MTSDPLYKNAVLEGYLGMHNSSWEIFSRGITVQGVSSWVQRFMHAILNPPNLPKLYTCTNSGHFQPTGKSLL